MGNGGSSIAKEQEHAAYRAMTEPPYRAVPADRNLGFDAASVFLCTH